MGLLYLWALTGGAIYHDGPFTPMDAKAMDKKVDDGVAWGGGVRGANRGFSTGPGSNHCTRMTTKKYRVRDDREQCIMAFFVGD